MGVAVIWFARGFNLPESEERQYRSRRELDPNVRAAAWKLLPQLPHRQHMPGGHCGLLTWHQEACASRGTVSATARSTSSSTCPGRTEGLSRKRRAKRGCIT